MSSDADYEPVTGNGKEKAEEDAKERQKVMRQS